MSREPVTGRRIVRWVVGVVCLGAAVWAVWFLAWWLFLENADF